MEVPACAVGSLAPAHDWRERDTGRSCGACGLVWREAIIGRRKAYKFPPDLKRSTAKVRIGWNPSVVERLIERDGDRCSYCRRQFSDEIPWTRDHRVTIRELKARANRGEPFPAFEDPIDNLVLACRPCNVLRGHTDEDLFRLGIEDGTIDLPWKDWT